MFGHVDAGVLHVRPALDMCDPQQEILMKQISDEVVALTAKYGGLLWGEHGKGFRAEYSPAFFGEQLYAELRKVKAAFDPHNRLNPGKICPPEGVDAPMLQVDAVKRGTYDRQIPIAVRSSWRGAMECNGNGLCFNFDVKSPMCPSMKITSNRIHSPKGGRRWCASGCACSPTAGLIRSGSSRSYRKNAPACARLSSAPATAGMPARASMISPTR